MKTILSFIESLPVHILMGASILLVIFLGFIDYLTGLEIGFFIFYLVPIAIGAWYTGRKNGLLLSLCSALTWFVADQAAGHVYSSPVIQVWNSVMRLISFLIVTWLLAGLHENVKRVNQQKMRMEKKRTIIQTSQQITGLLAENIGVQNVEILKWIHLRKKSGHQVSETVETASRRIGSCLHVLTEVSYLDPFTFDSVDNINSHMELLKSKLIQIQDEFQVRPAKEA